MEITNPISLTIVQLLLVDGNRLELGNLDILDGTPLLDIKAYVPDFDRSEEARAGWPEVERGKIMDARSDDRFR